jgi:outer membrane protein assembly factor BamE (lipoprotein component of BamABCDE complex)
VRTSWFGYTVDVPQIGNTALKGLFDLRGLDPSLFGAYNRKGLEKKDSEGEEEKQALSNAATQERQLSTSQDSEDQMRADRYSTEHKRILFLCIAIYLMMAGIGCTHRISQKGVSNEWRDASLPSVEKGRTTQSQVLERFGPPSQVIALSDQVVFYYMLERSRFWSFFLAVYNRSEEKIRYDRAIFFFDRNGVLAEYAYSREEVRYAESQ